MIPFTLRTYNPQPRADFNISGFRFHRKHPYRFLAFIEKYLPRLVFGMTKKEARYIEIGPNCQGSLSVKFTKMGLNGEFAISQSESPHKKRP